MKKKTNKLMIALLIACFLVGVFGIFYYFNKNGKLSKYININKKLAGEVITDGVFLYKLDIGEGNRNITIYNNNIIYWIEKNDKYEFYKTNIYNNKTEKIGEFDSVDSYCYLESD